MTPIYSNIKKEIGEVLALVGLKQLGNPKYVKSLSSADVVVREVYRQTNCSDANIELIK